MPTTTRIARNPVTGEWSQPYAVTRSEMRSEPAGPALVDGQLARLGAESIPLAAISSVFVASRNHPIAGAIFGSLAFAMLHTYWTLAASIGWLLAGLFLLTTAIGCFFPRYSLAVNLNSGRILTLACRNRRQAAQGRRELETALIERPQRVIAGA